MAAGERRVRVGRGLSLSPSGAKLRSRASRDSLLVGRRSSAALFLFRSPHPIMSDFDPAKLAALQARASKLSLGSKGAPRRKVIAKTRPTAGDDKKLQGALKKLNVQALGGVEEVNMFRDDGHVLHFTAPKVHAALPSNTLAIYGQGQEKELTELVPGILNQLGPEAMASLRRIAEAYQAQASGQGAAVPGGEAPEADDTDLPELVENKEPSALEEIN